MRYLNKEDETNMLFNISPLALELFGYLLSIYDNFENKRKKFKTMEKKLD